MTAAKCDIEPPVTRKLYPTKRNHSRIIILKIMNLLDRGYSNYEISKELNISRSNLPSYLRRIHKIIRHEQKQAIENLIFIAQRRHMISFNAAREEFEISKKDSKGNRKPGNPIFLQVMNESVRDIRKLLGLDKTQDIVNNNTNVVFNWDTLTQPIVTHKQNPEQVFKSGDGNKELALEELKGNRIIDRTDEVEKRIRELEIKAREIERLKDLGESQSTIVSSAITEIPKPQEPIVEPSSNGDIPSQEYVDPEPVEQPKRKIILKKKDKQVQTNNNPLHAFME